MNIHLDISTTIVASTNHQSTFLLYLVITRGGVKVGSRRAHQERLQADAEGHLRAGLNGPDPQGGVELDVHPGGQRFWDLRNVAVTWSTGNVYCNSIQH